MHLLEQGHTVHAVHAQIGDQQVGPESRQAAQRQFSVLNRHYFESCSFQAQGKQPQQTEIIVDKQNTGRLRHGAG